MGSSMGSYKLNTSGYSGGKQRPTGYGGILRDERGCWMRGFMGNLGTGFRIVDAEMSAIIKGVELIDSLRLKNVTLEADLFAFYILENPEFYTDNCTFIALVSDCQRLIKKNGIKLSSIPPEENGCADFLAKLAVDDDDEYTDVLDPPPGIQSLILADVPKFVL